MSNQKKVEDLSVIKFTNNRREFWIPYPSSDFSSSLAKGKEQAREYLEYLHSDYPAPILASIVRDISNINASTQLNHGQLIGFFATLEEALKSNSHNYSKSEK